MIDSPARSASVIYSGSSPRRPGLAQDHFTAPEDLVRAKADTIRLLARRPLIAGILACLPWIAGS
jgi:hypothetical protein